MPAAMWTAPWPLITVASGAPAGNPAPASAGKTAAAQNEAPKMPIRTGPRCLLECRPTPGAGRPPP